VTDENLWYDVPVFRRCFLFENIYPKELVHIAQITGSSTLLPLVLDVIQLQEMKRISSTLGNTTKNMNSIHIAFERSLVGWNPARVLHKLLY
jgi:hypothetical protein